MYVIVELRGGESPGVKSNWVEFGVIWRYDGENGGEGVVRGVSFEDDLCVWNPMSQYQSSGEGFFEHVQVIFVKASEDLMDMFAVLFHVV